MSISRRARAPSRKRRRQIEQDCDLHTHLQRGITVNQGGDLRVDPQQCVVAAGVGRRSRWIHPGAPPARCAWAGEEVPGAQTSFDRRCTIEGEWRTESPADGAFGGDRGALPHGPEIGTGDRRGTGGIAHREGVRTGTFTQHWGSPRSTVWARWAKGAHAANELALVAGPQWRVTGPLAAL